MHDLTSDTKSWSSSPGLTSVEQLTPGGLRLLLDEAAPFLSQLSALPTSVDALPQPQTDTRGSDVNNTQILSVISYYANPYADQSILRAFDHPALREIAGGCSGSLYVDASAKGGGNTSAKKGETIADTLSCMECYSDVCVLRHSDPIAVEEAVARSKKKLILAGGGGAQDVAGAFGDLISIIEALKEKGRHIGDGGRPISLILCGNLADGNAPASELVVLLSKITPKPALAEGSTVLIVRCVTRAGFVGLSFQARAHVDECASIELVEVPVQSPGEGQGKGGAIDDTELAAAIGEGDVIYVCGEEGQIMIGGETGLKKMAGAIILAADGDDVGIEGRANADCFWAKQSNCRLAARMAIFRLLLA